MSNDRVGLLYGLSSYVLWGVFPLYFHMLVRSDAYEIVASRVVFSLVFCAIILTIAKKWSQVKAVLVDRRATLTLALAGGLLAVNWTIYVWGVTHGHAIDGALGYFINPLVNAAFGLIFLSESIRRLQWIAFGVGALAVAVLIVGYGQVPWVALSLAFTFGGYALAKKTLGKGVPPLAGLSIETATVAPIALAVLIWFAATGTGTLTPLSPYSGLLALSGLVTAVPLLLFAAATPHVTLSTLGILQYVAPVLQFFVGWLIIGEQMPAARWLGFSIIWVAIAIFAVDAIISQRHSK